MRKLIVMALVVGCLGVLASVAMAATKSVKVGDNYYVRPRACRRSPSRRARRSSGASAPAPRTRSPSSRGPAKFNSGVRSSGSYSKKLTKRGTYVIYCTIHGFSDQRMKLVVK